MNNDFYIYVYYRLDTNEPFYVGKGSGRRWKRLKRNKHFNNIVKSIPTVAVIEKDNLTEAEAFYWEEEIIKQLVFEYGFSIDIKGNNSNNHYCHLTNKTWGGEGSSGRTPSEETRKKISEGNKGKNHWENMTEEQKEETKRKMSEARKGKNPLDYMTEEAKKERGKKISQANSGKNNPKSICIICLTTKMIFYSINEGAKKYKCDVSCLAKHCKGKHKSCGKLPDGTPLVWRYLNYKHNKKLRPINNKLKRIA